MEINQYMKETLRTFAYTNQPIENSVMDMLHCAIGIQTECGELLSNLKDKTYINEINKIEEIGDIMWYVSNLLNFMKKDFPKSAYKFNNGNMLDLSVMANEISSEILDVFKKHIFYKNTLNQEIFDNLKQSIMIKITLLIDVIYSICQKSNLTIEYCCEKNIAKLRIRYPEKFTNELANNRNVESEQNELKK